MKVYWLTIIVFLMLYSEGLSQKVYDSPDFILHIAPKDSNDGFGLHRKIGHFNDDIYQDLVVLAPHFHNTKGEKVGKAYLYYGTHIGVDTTSCLEIEGIYPNGGWWGEDLEALCRITTGDFNNDGYDDLALGAPNYESLRTLGWSKGYAMLFLSRSDGSGLNLDEYIEFMGYTARGCFADWLHCGDVNGDHIDDLIISASHSEGFDEGRIYIYYGGNSFDNVYDKKLQSTGNREGLRCSAVRDINNDGFDDVVGWDSKYTIETTQIHVWFGNEDISSIPAFSRSIHYYPKISVRDLNNDLFADILISMSANKNPSGLNPNLMLIKGDSTFDINNDTEFVLKGHHSRVSAIRDVNGDNIKDIFVDLRDKKDRGTTYVFSGDETNFIDVSDTLLKFIDSDSSYGLSVGNITPADMNGDGKFEYYGNSKMKPYGNVIFIYDNFPGLIAGSVNYYSDSLLMVNDALVSLTGVLDKEDRTNIDGCYNFTHLAWGNYTTRPSKKNDLNNAISAYDAALMLRYAVGYEVFSPFQMMAADVSGNGEITPYDASLILRYTVGLIDSFPVMPDTSLFWTFIPTNFAIDSTNWSTTPDSLCYEPLISDTLNQNYVGIIYGDVSGNWRPAGSQIVSHKLSPETIKISLGAISCLKENMFSIPIQLEKGSDLFSASFTLEYDPTLLKILDVNPTDLTSNFSTFYKINERDVKIALAGIKPLTDTGAIIQISYEKLKESYEYECPLFFSEVFVNEHYVKMNVQHANYSLMPSIPTEFNLSQNYPNPFNSETIIHYQSPHSCKVTLRILNLLGQEVKTLVEEQKEAGFHKVSWNGRNNNELNVASGIYLYCIEAGDFAQMRKLIILR